MLVDSSLKIKRDYLYWVNSQLTPVQLRLYLVLLTLEVNGGCFFQGAELVPLIGRAETHPSSRNYVQRTMQDLQRLQFICYTAIGKLGGGYHVYWIRKAEGDKPKGEWIGRHTGEERILQDPNGKKHIIYQKKFTQFCKEHGLNMYCIYKVARGENKTHKGWKVVQWGAGTVKRKAM